MHDDPPRRRRHPRRRTHLLAHDADVEDETRTRTVVERAERGAYADAAGARRWIGAIRVAEKSDDDARSRGCASTLRDDTPSVVRRPRGVLQVRRRRRVGVRARRTIAGPPPGRSPGSPRWRSRPTSVDASMCRAKATLDAAASSLLVPRATASVRLAAALDAMLEETRLTYVEIQGDAVHLAQAFQWLQEKTLFAAGAVLRNPAPGVHLAGSDSSATRSSRCSFVDRCANKSRRIATRGSTRPGPSDAVLAPEREVRSLSTTRFARFGRRRARQRRTRAREVEMRVRTRPRGDDGVGRHAGETPRDGRRRIPRPRPPRFKASSSEIARRTRAKTTPRGRREAPESTSASAEARAAISISRHPRRRRSTNPSTPKKVTYLLKRWTRRRPKDSKTTTRR